MTDYEIIDYLFLVEQAHENKLPDEEVPRFIQLTIAYLRQCDIWVENLKDEHEEMLKTLDAMWKKWYQNELTRAACITFLDEKGLSDEFAGFVESNIDEIEQKRFHESGIN